MKMLLILQIIMATNFRKFNIQCLEYVDKQLCDVKDRFQGENIKSAFSDKFMQYLRNKTLKCDVTEMERQSAVKRMYYKLNKAEKMSHELKKYSYPLFSNMNEDPTTNRFSDGSTPGILDYMLNYWEPGNPDYPVCPKKFNFGIPKNLTIVHRYLLPVTKSAMFSLKPLIRDIINNFTHEYEPTSLRPPVPPIKPTLTTTTEQLSAAAEAEKRYDNEALFRRYGCDLSEYTKSESKNKGRTFFKKNNTMVVHDLDYSSYPEEGSGFQRRIRFTRPPGFSNKTTLRSPSKMKRKKYWGPRIYETLKLMNDSKRVKKILSDYNEFVLNRGSSFHFGHDTMYESQYDSSSF